jgi:hypothetical protein
MSSEFSRSSIESSRKLLDNIKYSLQSGKNLCSPRANLRLKVPVMNTARLFSRDFSILLT